MLFSAFRFGKTHEGDPPQHPLVKIFIVLGFVILGIIAVTALAVLFGFIVMWLWNALMPTIFNLPEIGYWQAVGLVVLSHIFFGSHNSFKSNGSRNKINKKNNCDEKHVYINKNGHEEHYDTFREFWNGYGSAAFDKWLNRNETKTTPEEV